MSRHVALLRGINVGGRKRVAMADLRQVVASLGHTDVVTYIQSGNVVFTAAGGEADTATLAATLERAFAENLGVAPKVVVLSRDQLAQVIADNPFPGESDPKCLHAVFRNDDLGREGVAHLALAAERARSKGSHDEAQLVGRTLYLHTPGGLGRSVLAIELGRAKGALSAGADSTVRNWATVLRLLALCDA
ncbi:MAG: DUF1697 domain-containing protein [Actinomycetota bacterium]|jgi:uncharacterized protein (DUF1697 family)|nr:DUF1697 domain-containing protein [Actinomycetota bacterium]